MAQKRTYCIVRRNLDIDGNPRDALNVVNSSLNPRVQGQLAVNHSPITGLDRWLEPSRELEDGILAVRMTPLEADVFADYFPHLQVSEETYLHRAESWIHREEHLNARPATRHWTANFEISDVSGHPIRGAKVVASIPGMRGVTVARTNELGMAVLYLPRTDACFHVIPAHSYWDRYIGTLNPSEFLRPISVTLESLNIQPGFQWDLRASGMDQAREVEPDQPVRIALIDTGVAEHPDLPGNIVHFDCATQDHEDPERRDPDGHGTAMAGILVAGAKETSLRGYAPRAALRSYRVFPSVGPASELNVAAAITKAVDDGAEVICLALATPFCEREPIALREALKSAGRQGVLCAISAGNEGEAVSWPAAFGFGHCLSVGAIGRTDIVPPRTTHELAVVDHPAARGYFLAAFSNRNKGGGRIDFVAPGVACPSTVRGGYAAVSGTSIATAHVAGMVAAMLERYPDIRNAPANQKVGEIVGRMRLLAIPFDWGNDLEGHGQAIML